MCNPMAMAAASVITSMASTYQQIKVADDTLDAQNRATKLQIQENNKGAALDKLENQRNTMKAKGEAQTGAADAGVGGNSMLREYATLEIQGQHDEGIIESTRKSANAMAEAQSAANAASYESAIAAANSTLFSGMANAAKTYTSGLK